MSAIPCASVNMKTMADGTLRISFDIEPNHAQDAFRLFAAPGTPAAIAALQVGYAAVGATKEAHIESPPEKPKGGALSKLAGMWCADPEFLEWADSITSYSISNAKDAAEYIRDICEIKSRAELDHDEAAAERFHKLIRGPFSKYMLARGKTTN